MPRPNGALTPEENRHEAHLLLSGALSNIIADPARPTDPIARDLVAVLDQSGYVDWSPLPPGFHRFEVPDGATVLTHPHPGDPEIDALIFVMDALDNLNQIQRTRVLNYAASRMGLAIAIGRGPTHLTPDIPPDPNDEPF